MKCIATINVDLEHSPLGTRSRLAEDLLGEPVLRRTVTRVLAASRLARVFVLAPQAQAARVAELLAGLTVSIVPHDGNLPPHAALVRAGRVWGLDGWRGGIGGLCAFDEDINVPLAAAVAAKADAEAVASIPAAAAVIDPAMIDAMVDHFETSSGAFRLAIVQAPPGLGLAVFARALLEELAPSGQPPGALLTYQPSHPGPDITGKPACYRPPAEVVEARGRLLCDTQRSLVRVRDLLADGGGDWDARRVAQCLASREFAHVDAVPEEIEIELTTEEPFSSGSSSHDTGRARARAATGDSRSVGSLLHPRGEAVGRRGPISMEAIRSVAAAIAEYDDVRIVLGGFGEPCCHPRFAEICRVLRDSTAAAVAVRTAGELGDSAVEKALFETPVDVVEVTLDAATRETYRQIHGVDRFDEVAARLESWLARRISGKQVRPVIVPSFVKAKENLHEMEQFFDRWQQRLGSVLVTGYSHCAGQRPRRAVTSMAPPQRGPCRRVFKRLSILADGRVTTCDQDFAGKQTFGSLADAPLGELWHSACLAAIRSGDHARHPLCPACDEWHRP
jgi:hypothetical protein